MSTLDYIPVVILLLVPFLLVLASVKSKLKKYRLRSPFVVMQPKKKRRHSKPPMKKKTKRLYIGFE